jgi:hypothetical protein
MPAQAELATLHHWKSLGGRCQLLGEIMGTNTAREMLGEALSTGRVVIQYYAENLHIVDVFG